MVEAAKTDKERRSSRKHRRVPLLSRRHRSAITNGRKLLVDADHRSAFLRRFRDIIAEHTNDLGGAELCSESELALVRCAAQLRIQLELMEQRWSDKFDGVAPLPQIITYQRVANSLRRILESLGLKRRSRDVTPDLQTYLREKRRQQEEEEIE